MLCVPVLVARRVAQVVGFVLLLASSPCLWAQNGPSCLAPADSTQPADDSLLAGIHGIVVSPEGSVYEGVAVSLSAASAGVAPAKVTTDANGHFAFTGITPGAFRLTISTSGFKTQTIAGYLHPGESYEVPPVVLLMSSAANEVRVTATQIEIAQEQVKEEEKQRVLGFLPNFYVVYAPNALPLSARQKFGLAWKSSIDPVAFIASGVFAGIEQANNDFSGYGQGAQGYAKRYGANYADGFISTMIGGAILPSLLKQDPRYFYKGTGTVHARALYAIAMSVVSKGDNGHWQPNYSGIAGSLAAGGISNLYYPASDRDAFGLTVTDTVIGIGGTAIQNLFQEFVVRHFTPHLPNYGTPKP